MKIIRQVKQYGIINSFSRGLKLFLRICGINIESYILYKQHINLSKIGKVEINPNYKIKKLNYLDYKNSKGLKFDEFKLNIFINRFDCSTYEAYGIYDSEKLIYSSWISIKQLEVSMNTLDMKLNSNEGLLLDIITHPDYRRQGLHNYMNIYCLRRIKELGKAKAVVMVLKENVPAIKSQERSGFRKSKKINFYEIWGTKQIKIKKF